ncbi:MAG: FecR domain-containing protein [Pseudomonadota bacterium]
MRPTDDLPKSIRDEAARWFSLIDSGTATDEELRELEDWRSADPLHEHAYDRMATLWSALGTLTAEDVLKESAHQNNIPHQDRQGDTVQTFPQRSFPARPKIQAMVAALMLCIAGVSTIMFLDRPKPSDGVTAALKSAYSSGLGETKSVTLTDGSTITLGALTVVKVEMTATKRFVRLERGAVVLDVVKDADRPFFVRADDFSARVVGTVFDVRSNGGVVRLSVLEGKVVAAHPVPVGSGRTSLFSRKEVAAGERVSATSAQGLSDVNSFPVNAFAAWRDDRLKYSKATLRELIADANRYSQTPIVLEGDVADLNTMTVTVSFVGTDIDNVLATLPSMFPVTVDRADASKIVIRAN